MGETQEQLVRLPYAIRISDFFVDFFGGLIPGIVFTATFLLILVNLCLIILSICSACLSAPGTHKLSIIEQLITIRNIPEISVYFYFLFTIIFIVASYILGFIF